MRWTRDTSGRFRERPHYSNTELEQICEDEICNFLRNRHGKVSFPVSTSDLTVLLEKHVDDLDTSTDLDEGVDGLSHFFPKRKPQVKISARLHLPYLENRLRTTLTHEHGHVILHGFLFALDDQLRKLFGSSPKDARNTCHRDDIHGGAVDWMEWQAGFACGALLMPRSELMRVVKAFRDAEALLYTDIGVATEAGKLLITRVMREFQVSENAARVRLEQSKLVVQKPEPSLFG